ncbi:MULTISPECIES: DUF3142 domain-containing protein [Buttiauxella]|uniref:DUF3142 domain-containing protein n=1 Tax=Buttiauxella TaxID=82976 RepID=UPI0007E483AE|nr:MULTISPECIES: DUF3142 domain-containing protein [Buttiauxella]TDN49012.1 uncharacterized protein DUF3142 [Buttiauxella sp. JUb87]
MGKTAQLLLVTLLLLLATIVPPAMPSEAKHQEYTAYWLWSGVSSQPALQNAQVVYLHQGEIVSRQNRAKFIKLGVPRSPLAFPSVWVTVRTTTLDVPDDILNSVLDLPGKWAAAGNHVVGLQIDFDAGTYRLQDYQKFLLRVRHKLDKRFALGVTGLLDWAKTGSIQQLNALPIDELVIQTYQGKTTVKEYQRYLPALLKLRVPFKIGLVQNGEWDKSWQTRLATSSFYRGEVVFLLNSGG